MELVPIEIAKLQFEDIKKQFTRYKKYFDTIDNRIAIPVKLLNEDEELVCLFYEVINRKDKSFFLFGKGGTGKTHIFMELFNKLIKCERLGIVPFYIPLNSVQPDKYSNCIIGELTERLKNPSTMANLTENEVISLLQSENVNILLLADGLNEVTNKDKRVKIARALSDIVVSETYRNTRVMLSSRENHSFWFQGLGLTSYTQLEIQKLSWETIDNYLEKAGCVARYNDVPATTKKLLKTAMGLSMYSELVGNDKGKINTFQTLGGLLKAYMCLLLNSQNTTIPYEEFLYSVAEKMIDNKNSFTIYKSSLTQLWNGDIDSILDQLSSVLCLQGINSEGIDEYTFLHQNFRDMLISKRLAERILNLSLNGNVNGINQIIKNGYITTNRELMNLTADYLQGKNSEIQNIIRMMPKDNSRSYQLSVLINLYARINQNSIANLDLSGHDLSNIRLSGYKLFDNECHVKLNGCTLDIDTFSMPGLTQASSTITKYKIGDELFLIAFSITSYLKYNASKNKVQVNKNLKSFGRINCCCNVTKDKHIDIILGTDKGFIHKFDTCSDSICYNITNTSASSDEKAIDSIAFWNSKIFFTKKEKQEEGLSVEYKVFSFDLSKPSEIEVIHEYKSYYNSSVLSELENQYPKYEYSILKQQIERSRGRFSQTDSDLYYAVEDKVFIYKDNMFYHIELCDIPCTISCLKFSDIIVSEPYMLINNDDSILAFFLSNDADHVVARYINGISISEYKEKSGDYFTKFSRSDKDDRILVGIGIDNDDLRGNINFLEIKICKINYLDETFDFNCNPLYGLHTKTTHTGVYFSKAQGEGVLLATVSDDRSVQIMQPDNEDFERIQFLGEYNGVHSIVAIDNPQDPTSQSLICAGYDGCIEKWKCKRNKWYCVFSRKIHKNWIWKIKFIKYNDKEFVFSCSYDGTIKMTELTQNSSKTLLKTNTKIYDLDIKLNNEDNIISIIATTDYGYYTLKSFSFKKLLEKFYQKNSTGLLFYCDVNINNNKSYDNWSYCSFNDKLCMGRSTIIKGTNELFVAVFNKEKKTLSLEKISNINSSSDSMGVIPEFYARCMDISRNYLVLAGNLTTEKDKGYVDLYDVKNNSIDEKTKIFSYKFEECSSVNDIRIRVSDDIITLYLLHKDKWLTIITFSIKSNGDMTIKKIKISVRTQPMCLTIDNKNRIFIGTVDGEVSLVEQEVDNLKSQNIIQVRANLISDGNILISRSNEFKQSLDEFRQTFNGYFAFR